MKIVRVTAMWCMSCLAMKKVWKQVFAEYSDIEIIDYDFDMDTQAIEQYNIGKILPELIVFKDNIEVKRIVGEKSKTNLFQILEELHETN
ncbi:MAG: thioredoxin family protein [Bacilli bacterium]|nr:thioredoxin family protein [Bacilli bacterium]MBN2877220.1 thioredoxin family protein [Bacilli bacterium]